MNHFLKYLYLEVFVEASGAHDTLQLGAGAQAATLWQRVGSGSLAVVTQQLVLAAELQVTHVAGEQLHAHVGQSVGDAGSTVGECGPTKFAQAKFGQVSESVTSDDLWVCSQRRQARFTGQNADLRRWGAVVMSCLNNFHVVITKCKKPEPKLF